MAVATYDGKPCWPVVARAGAHGGSPEANEDLLLHLLLMHLWFDLAARSHPEA